MDNWRNLTFDGGWDASGNGRPLGWQLDSIFGAGAGREPTDVVWGDAYRITADGATAARGLISQNGIVEDDAGRPVMASLARLTCEMYMLADPAEGKPRERYARLLALHDAGERDLLARGLDDAHAWLPPPVAKRFGRRLTALGWVRDDTWTPYCRRLRPGDSL
jgi:hypothetical protein